VIPDQPKDADAAASEIPHLSSVVSPRPIGFGIASAIAYVFCVTAAFAPMFKGIDVTIDIAKTIKSAIANLFEVFMFFSFPYNSFMTSAFLQKYRSSYP
jgi:hypothetical protein